MTRELVDYIHMNYSNFLNEEERKLHNKLKDYANWLRVVKKHGIDIMKDKMELFDLTIDEINSLASIDRKRLD
jgi:lysozyme family protein